MANIVHSNKYVVERRNFCFAEIRRPTSQYFVNPQNFVIIQTFTLSKSGCRGHQPLHENWRSYQTNQGTGKPLLCLFYAQKKTALIRKPSLMLSEILLCNKCQSISCNEKLFVCWDNVNLCLRIVCGDLLEYSTAEILLSVNVDTEDIEI